MTAAIHRPPTALMVIVSANENESSHDLPIPQCHTTAPNPNTTPV